MTRPRPRRGRDQAEPAGLPDHGLRQVQVRGGAEGQGVPRKSTNVADQGDEVPAQDRRRRLRHQDPQGRAVPRRGPQGEGHDHVPRPRDGSTPSSGKRILDRVAEEVVHLGRVEVVPEARRPQHDHGAGARQEGPGSPRQEAGRDDQTVPANGTSPDRSSRTSRRGDRVAAPATSTGPDARVAEPDQRCRRHRCRNARAGCAGRGRRGQRQCPR